MRRLKILIRVIVAAFVIFWCVADARAQNTTNLGTEFWTAYMDHNNGASQGGVIAKPTQTGQKNLDTASLMSLYITSNINTSGTITIADGSFKPISFTVSANQVTIVTIPPSAFLGSAGLANKGIHILTLKPVAIYAHIYAQSVSGATLLLPVSTLGKDYFSINYTQHSNAAPNNPAYSAFIIIATEDNTTVKIIPSAALIDNHQAAQPFTISLNKGQLYQGLSGNDLTGTKITSVNSATGGCTRIAVFSGSSRIDVGCNPSFVTSDNLFQQVYPTASWGKNYITVPLSSRNYDVFRIILSNPQPATAPNIVVNGTAVSPFSFSNGIYEFTSQVPNVITSDQPIQVVQYAVSEDNTIFCGAFIADIGDPEMIFLNPLEQTIDHVTLYSTGNFEIERSFINVVIKASDVASFLIDGKSYSNFTAIPSNPLYAYAQIPVQGGPQNIQSSTGNSQGTHTLSAANGFNAIAYGFGQAESYGYAAGTNLQNLNENITFVNPANNSQTQANGCEGTPYKLLLTLPYQTTNIVWDFKNGTTYTDSNPQIVSTTIKGTQTLYQYQYYKTVSYSTPGDTSIVATVFDPVAGECGNNEAVDFDFNISPQPAANFTFSSSCFGDSTLFSDQTNANGNAIKTWLWDFGDQTISTQQNPKHPYLKPGAYKVMLTVTNNNGCATDTTILVNISNKPVASFAVSSSVCVGKNVTYTDNSTVAGSKIVQWLWDFGDGTRDTLTNNNPVNHIYKTAGTDTVKLIVVTDGGCMSLAALQSLIVNPFPVVDFTMPVVCVNDPYAQFTDESTIADNTSTDFTYLWDFGDLAANTSNPNTSTQQNPKHKYSQAGNYNVTLTVTSKYGCSFSKTQSFTVNGEPSASFLVENNNNLCSSDNVIFDNQSTVSSGSIAKIVWYFDYNNNPADTLVFLKDSIPADGKFTHNYGLFNSPLSKSYTVRMDVYSGFSCVSTATKNIVIKANPLITLSAIGPLCQSSQPVQIIENKNGFTGTGVFNGTGVSPSGLFDPAASGVGVFAVNYVFTQQNGCSYSTTQQVMVSNDPQISLPSDIFILEGAQVALPAKASGDGLTYLWTPLTGLDYNNVPNPIASPSVNTTYQLIVTNAEGCNAAAEITVNVLKFPVIPNAFTPNGDGINDTWDIKYLNTYPNNTVDIFNRYGEKVFSSVGYTSPWDGTYRGAALPSGTYYYIINPKNGRKVMSGSVTIIR